MNKPTNWKEGEKKTEVDLVRERLECAKSGSIAFLEDKNKFLNGEIYHYHGEKGLTSNYWKNGREKINSFQTEKEVNFYKDRLGAIIEFVKNHTRKDIRYVEDAKPGDPINTPRLIDLTLKRMENISEEEFRKTDKGSNSGEGKELSVEEMLNDKGFSDEIDKLFGIDGKEKNNNPLKPHEDEGYNSDDNNDLSNNYESLSREELINEIKRLKTELQRVNSSQGAVNYQTNSKKLETQLHKAESVLNSFETPNTFPKPTNFLPIIGIVGSIIFLLVIAYKRKRN